MWKMHLALLLFCCACGSLARRQQKFGQSEGRYDPYQDPGSDVAGAGIMRRRVARTNRTAFSGASLDFPPLHKEANSRATNPLERFAALLLSLNGAAAFSSFCKQSCVSLRLPAITSSTPTSLRISRCAPEIIAQEGSAAEVASADVPALDSGQPELKGRGQGSTRIKKKEASERAIQRKERKKEIQEKLAPMLLEMEGQLEFWPGPRKLRGNHGALGKFQAHAQSKEETEFWQAQRDKLKAKVRKENGPEPSLLDLGLSGHKSASPRVLICGDADLAYSSLLAKTLQKATLFTSTFENEDELLMTYPHAADVKQELQQKGVSVQHGVDARKILDHYGEAALFDRIVFNLPYSAPRGGWGSPRIDDNIALLEELCISAADALAPDGELWITLLAGQGGTPVDPIQRDRKDSWQIIDAAANAGLLVRDVAEVDLPALEARGYTPTGRQGHLPLGDNRKQKGLVVHVLAAEATPQSIGDTSAQTHENQAMPVRSIVTFKHILQHSFWLGGVEAPTLEQILETAREALGPHASQMLSEPPQLLDVYHRDGRTSHLYAFEYRSRVLGLSRERVLQAHEIVAEALVQQYSFEHRMGAAASR